MRRILLVFALISLFGSTGVYAQDVLHQIEGRVRSQAAELRGIQVKLVLASDMRTITETFTTGDGRFVFKSLREGDYLVETMESDLFEATSTKVSVYPRDRTAPTKSLVMLLVDVPLKPAKKQTIGVITADVDLNVPKEAQKHYRAGMKALESADSQSAVEELRKAVAVYPNYYAARLALGRELRLQKKFDEAANVLEPLPQIAPGRAEPRIEYGIVLLNLKRRLEAARELNDAIRLEEASWAAHLYLGWAVLESDTKIASKHFTRALELDEQKAARAHLALGQIANNEGRREEAFKHLVAYLTLAPNASDAQAVRKLAETLRK
jgi:tetratricopeptide (TPR) repeat protein